MKKNMKRIRKITMALAALALLIWSISAQPMATASVNPVGGISVTSVPKPLVIASGSSGVLNIKLISTANIDDTVEVTINTNDLASSYAINLGWFDKTSATVNVPAGQAILVPFSISVPLGTPSGYKSFKNNAKSLGFSATSIDTGVVNVFDIHAYYRGLGNDPNVVETTDILKAIEDFRNNIIPQGFNRPLSAEEVVELINEWGST